MTILQLYTSLTVILEDIHPLDNLTTFLPLVLQIKFDRQVEFLHLRTWLKHLLNYISHIKLFETTQFFTPPFPSLTYRLN